MRDIERVQRLDVVSRQTLEKMDGAFGISSFRQIDAEFHHVAMRDAVLERGFGTRITRITPV